MTGKLDRQALKAADKTIGDFLSGPEFKKTWYYPQFRQMTPSVTSAIFLSRVIERWKQKGEEAFYKFNAPCQHADYRDGDSWEEETGFTRWELETARKHIATRIKKGDSKQKLFKFDVRFLEQSDKGVFKGLTHLIAYWRDDEDRLWYEVNEVLLKAYLLKISNPELPNEVIQHYLVMLGYHTTHEKRKYRITRVMRNRRNTYKDSQLDCISTHVNNQVKDISPQGESSPKSSPMKTFIEEELFEDDEKKPEPQKPEPAKVVFTDQQLLMASVQIGFGKGGGFAGMLGKQLTGTADKGQRKDWNIAPGMNPIEIVAFAIWYGTDDSHNYEGKPPTTAETLYERVEEFRGLQDIDADKYNNYMQRGYTALRKHLAQSPKVKKLKEEKTIDMSDDPIWDDIAELAEGWGE